MPIYEYECSACGHHIEILQGINDPLLTECPDCNITALRKLISPTAFRLKGSGWYATDFRDKSNKKSKTDDKDNSASKGDPKDSSDTSKGSDTAA
jgi:putative FmdB family regulatory protein